MNELSLADVQPDVRDPGAFYREAEDVAGVQVFDAPFDRETQSDRKSVV